MCVLAGVVELAVLQDGVACASQPRQQGAASGAEVRPVWLGAGASREGGMQGSLAQVRWWSKALDAGVVAARRSSALVRGGADLEGAASWRSRARQSVAELDEVEGAWPMDHSALDPMGFLRSTSRRAKPSTHGLLQWVDADAMPHSGQACALGLSEQALRGREGPSVEGLVVPTREADLLHVDVQEAGLGVARAGKAAAVWPRGRVDVRAGWKVHIKVGRGAGLPLLRDSPPRAPILTAVHHVEPPAGGAGGVVGVGLHRAPAALLCVSLEFRRDYALVSSLAAFRPSPQHQQQQPTSGVMGGRAFNCMADVDAKDVVLVATASRGMVKLECVVAAAALEVVEADARRRQRQVFEPRCV
jgi:hypothetical protein